MKKKPDTKREPGRWHGLMIDTETHNKLKELAEETDRKMHIVVARALSLYAQAVSNGSED